MLVLTKEGNKEQSLSTRGVERTTKGNLIYIAYIQEDITEAGDPAEAEGE